MDGDTWLVTMVNKCPLRIGLWDPFQMTLVLWLTNGGGLLTTYKSWDDPPSTGRGAIPMSTSDPGEC